MTAGRRIPDLLSDAAAHAPDAVAIRWGRTTWTYARWNEASDDLARTLVAVGVQPGDRVGMGLAKRPEALAAMFGILRTGAIYTPIDPRAPEPWLSSVASEGGLAAFIGLVEHRDMLERSLGDRGPSAFLLLDPAGDGAWEVHNSAVAPERSERPPPGPVPEGFSVLFFTSGSTGRPKGVMHTHIAILTGPDVHARTLGLQQDDRVALHAPLYFKMSMESMLAAMMVRASLVLVPLETAFRGLDLARLIRAEGVTYWKSVPTAIGLLAEWDGEPGALPLLRHVVAGGGGWRPADLPRIRRLAPDAALWQSFGSAETSTIALRRLDPEDDGAPVPLGRPLEGVRIRILRADGSASDPGEPGELVMASPKLMSGYWGEPERTASVLSFDPTDGSGPWYRTGDHVVEDADGLLWFVGRQDQRVKTRGYRVELGSIEEALRGHPAVRDAAAVGVPHTDWGVEIVAFVEGRDGALEAGPMRAHVAERLPMYMVPTRIRVVAALPRLANGKLDRVALAASAAETPF